MKHLVYLVPCILLGLTALGHAASEIQLSGQPDQLTRHLDSLRNRVSLEGHSEVLVAVDYAEVRMTVSTSHRNLSNALNRNTEVRESLKREMLKLRIPGGDMKFARLTSTPSYGRISGKLREYTVDNQVRVNIRSDDQFAELAALIESMDEVTYEGMEPKVTNREKHRKASHEKALAQVQDRKALYETQLGITLTPASVATIRRSDGLVGIQAGTPPSGPYITGTYFGASAATPLPARAARSDSDGGAFGEVAFRAHIVVEYRVVGKEN